MLDEQVKQTAGLDRVVTLLRGDADRLQRRGMSALSVFGSVARGVEQPGSDVDLLAEFSPSAAVSLVTLASLRSELSELLGLDADLVEVASLRPAVAEAARREAVRVF